MNIEEFCKQEAINLERFKSWWINQNKINQESFPLEISNDNCGLWDEQFKDFKECVKN